MQKRFYLDTSIWRDYFEDRTDSIRPLGELVASFLQECRARGCKILYSDLILRELSNVFSLEQIRNFFSAFEDNLVQVKPSVVQRLEGESIARERPETHSADALHAVMARDHQAVLVARDHGFECLRDLVEVRKPEEVIFD